MSHPAPASGTTKPERAELGPQATSVETILRVAKAMSTRQVSALAEASRTTVVEREAARNAAHQASLRRTTATLRTLQAEHSHVFPDLRKTLTDDEGRIGQLIARPAIAAATALAFVLAAGALIAAFLAARGSGSWLAAMLAAAAAVGVFVAATGAVVARMSREDARLAAQAQAAWIALMDAALAVTVLDLCGTTSDWTLHAYRTLTAPWEAAVLPLPQPAH